MKCFSKIIASIKKWLDIRSPSKAMMRGWTSEDANAMAAMIEQMDSPEWEVTDYFDHIFDEMGFEKEE